MINISILYNNVIICNHISVIVIINIKFNTGKYCEFHHMYGMGEFREAASLLVSLLVSNLTPK